MFSSVGKEAALWKISHLLQDYINDFELLQGSSTPDIVISSFWLDLSFPKMKHGVKWQILSRTTEWANTFSSFFSNGSYLWVPFEFCRDVPVIPKVEGTSPTLDVVERSGSDCEKKCITHVEAVVHLNPNTDSPHTHPLYPKGIFPSFYNVYYLI